MPFIGNQPAEKYSAFTKQDFSTSATTSYTLSQAVSNENEIALFINFVRQEPTTAYTASGTTLTLTSATSSSDDMYCVYLGKAVQTVNPASGSVGSSQLASDAVTAAKLNDDIISGQTALASEPADTDEFLVSDAGTLKRIDYSLIKGGGITNAQSFYLSSSQTISSGTTTVLTTWSAQDTTNFGLIGSASNVSVSSGIFSFATTGIYLIRVQMVYYLTGNRGTRYALGNIDVTTNNSSYTNVCQIYTNLVSQDSNVDYLNLCPSYILDVDDTTNVKFRTSVEANEEMETEYGNRKFRVDIIRLGDT